MAEFESTGVKLVAEGRDAYLAALQQARDATSAFNRATGELGGAFQSMSFASSAAAVAVGTVLGGALAYGISQVVNMSTAAIDMTSRLQDVRIGLESLTAQELISSGAAQDMNTAMEQAVPITDELMDRLKDISLASPFTYEEILGVFRLNKAFGQSIDMSLQLTKAITDLGAVNKGIPGVLERISYNFSQMAMIGQITSRDVRDLAMAGVNLNTILDKELGMTLDQVNQKLKSGQMTFEDVSKAFVNYVGKNFGDAAERASRTFSGLQSSFKDLAFFSSVDIFGGTLEVVTQKLSGLFDAAQKFVGAGGLQPVGAVLEVLTGELLNVGEVGIEAGANFFNEFGGQIMATADAALNWGINVTTQLGAGLIEGAAAAITAAMDFVSGLLSFFLAPGSPPRVAPDVDDWGASAMTEFLKGFTEADFDVVSGVGSSLNQALSALVSGGLIDKGDKEGIYQSIQQQLTEALASGGDLTPVLDSIRGSLGMYGEEVADLTLKQIALSNSLDAVKKAEEALTKARENEEKANADLVRITDEYNELAKAGASPEVLAAKRAEFEAAKKRRTEAAKSAKQAEKDLERGKAESKEMKEKVDLQQELVKQLIDLTKQEKEEEKLKTAKGGGKAADAAKQAAKAITSGLAAANDTVKKKMDELKETLKNKLRDAFKPIVDAWNGAVATVVPAWERFSTTISDFYNTYIKPVIDGIAGIIPPDLIQNIGWAAGVIGVLTIAFVGLSAIVGIVTGILGSLTAPIALIILGAGLLKTAWDNNWLGIRDTLTEVWINTIQPALSELWNWLQTNIPIAIQFLTNVWTTILLPALQAVWTWLSTVLLPFLQNLDLIIRETLVLALNILVEAWETIFLPAIQAVWEWLSTVLIPFLQALDKMLSETLALALTVLAGVWENVLWPAIMKVWDALSVKLQPVFDALIVFIEQTLNPAVEGAAGWIGGKLVEAFNAVSKAIQDATGWLVDLANKLRNIKLPDWMTPGSPTPWELGLVGVNEAMKDLARTGFPKLQAEMIATGATGRRAYEADAAAARLGLLGASSPVVVEKTVQSLTLQSSIQPDTVQQGFDAFRLLST